MNPATDPNVPTSTRELLARFNFDRIPFEAMRQRIAATADPESLHAIREAVSVPPENAARGSASPDSAEGRALAREGAEAIASGELGVVILAGGMATRFGAKVKGLAPVFDDRPLRFIDAKLADVARAGAGRAVDVTVMTSFATDEALRAALADRGVHFAPQFISLRLTPRGDLFHEASGELSPHATGHGDLPDALRQSGALDRLRAQGVKTVLVSNVDNLGATVDPIVFAEHRRGGAPITVELVSKRAGDKGGMPVARGNRLVLAEAFRLPKDFPQDSYPLFNTNTLWIDLPALEGDHPWTWCIARKKVGGADAIQIERLVGELTWWYPTQYLHVPREGVRTRFLPVKDVEDLRKARPEIELVLRDRVGI